MAIIAAGSKTIIDLSDGKSLSVYLGSNLPKTQINDVNANTFAPDWTTENKNLVITPVVYVNNEPKGLDDTSLSFTWKRQDGNAEETNLTAGETVSGNILTVNQNKLSNSASKLLTYKVTVVYTDPETSITATARADVTFALVQTGQNGQNAKTAWISGEQVFKYTAKGAVSPAQITLTANLQNVSMTKWQYKNSSGTWTDYPTTGDNASVTGTTLIVKPTHSIFVGSSATLRIVTSDENIGDTTSIYKVQDGATGEAGKDARIAFLTNENVTFTADNAGSVTATNFTCNVAAYLGTNKVQPTVTPIGSSSLPSGITVVSQEYSDNEYAITFKAVGAVGGSSLRGSIPIKITYPVNTTLDLTWSKALMGGPGQNATVFTIYSPDGTVFNNGIVHEGQSSQATSITLQTQYFIGSTNYTTSANVFYLWERYQSGAWVEYKAEAAGSAGGNTCAVSADDVQSSCAFRCRAKFGSASKNYYYDTITIIDKTDNYQADIDSTAGDIFKNTIGETCLICRLWQAGAEVDPLKCTTFSETAPSSPTGGTYYYKITKSPTVSHNTAVMRYSTPAGGWVDVSNNTEYGHTKTYKWYRRDKDGNPLDNGAVFATGKVIFINGDDVDGKTVFVCEVE